MAYDIVKRESERGGDEENVKVHSIEANMCVDRKGSHTIHLL